MASSVSKAIQKLYVGNLPWTVSHAELRKYFEQFGKVVSAKVIFDKNTGFSKKYGFVFVKGEGDVSELLNTKPVHVLEGKTLNIQKHK